MSQANRLEEEKQKSMEARRKTRDKVMKRKRKSKEKDLDQAGTFKGCTCCIADGGKGPGDM